MRVRGARIYYSDGARSDPATIAATASSSHNTILSNFGVSGKSGAVQSCAPFKAEHDPRFKSPSLLSPRPGCRTGRVVAGKTFSLSTAPHRRHDKQHPNDEKREPHVEGKKKPVWKIVKQNRAK